MIRILFFAVGLLAAACVNAQQPVHPPAQSHTPAPKPPRKPRLIRVDDFSPPDRLLDSHVELKSGPIVSSSKVWFTNKALNQTLVVELYTDGFHEDLFLFRNDDIPTAVIDSMELHTPDGDTATQKQKQKYFRGFLPKAKPLAAKYFTSDNGFALGDSSEKAIKTYGKPGRRTLSRGITVLSWFFEGENSWDGKTDLHGRPLAAGSFGHTLTMCFRDNRLIGLAINNTVP